MIANGYGDPCSLGWGGGGYLANSYPTPNGSSDPNATGSAAVVTSSITPEGGETQASSALQIYNPLAFAGLVTSTAVTLLTSGPAAVDAASSNLVSALGTANLAISVTGTVGVPMIPGSVVSTALSMIGVGPTLTFIGGSNQVILGPTFSLSAPDNNTGVTVTAYPITSGSNASSILSGFGGSVTIQPQWNQGVTWAASPSVPGLLAGYSIGSKTPGSFGGGYGFCIYNCTP